MNKRLYGLPSLPVAFDAPRRDQELRLGGGKKSPIQGSRVGCVWCGASKCTLRKLKVGSGRYQKERLLCPRCYARESNNA